jgi:hypothetical protein
MNMDALNFDSSGIPARSALAPVRLEETQDYCALHVELLSSLGEHGTCLRLWKDPGAHPLPELILSRRHVQFSLLETSNSPAKLDAFRRWCTEALHRAAPDCLHCGDPHESACPHCGQPLGWGQRRRLPDRRRCESASVVVKEQPWDLSVGCFENGSPAEIFAHAQQFKSSVKVGSDLQSLADDASVLLSVALQYGASIRALDHGMERNAPASRQALWV